MGNTTHGVSPVRCAIREPSSGGANEGSQKSARSRISARTFRSRAEAASPAGSACRSADPAILCQRWPQARHEGARRRQWRRRHRAARGGDRSAPRTRSWASISRRLPSPPPISGSRRRESATYHFVMEIWTEFELGEPFDAAVGRYVLMFNPAPAAMLRSVARLVRAGGRSYFMRLTGMGSVQTPRPRFMMNATHGLSGRSNSSEPIPTWAMTCMRPSCRRPCLRRRWSYAPSFRDPPSKSPTSR